MKIDSSTKPAGTSLVKESRGPATASKPGPAGEDVRLSSLATQLVGSDDQQSFDAARVAEIKQAITDGRFTINAGAIADRLIASAKELVDAQRQG
ncbi:MAG: flagellar biosynthesis anti-sigma factor FlgM [Propionivibrio sp.]